MIGLIVVLLKYVIAWNLSNRISDLVISAIPIIESSLRLTSKFDYLKLTTQFFISLTIINSVVAYIDDVNNKFISSPSKSALNNPHIILLNTIVLLSVDTITLNPQIEHGNKEG